MFNDLIARIFGSARQELEQQQQEQGTEPLNENAVLGALARALEREIQAQNPNTSLNAGHSDASFAGTPSGFDFDMNF